MPKIRNSHAHFQVRIFIASFVSIEKIKGGHAISGLSLLLIPLLIPSVIISNLLDLSIFLVYGILVLVFFVVLVYLARVGKLGIK